MSTVLGIDTSSTDLSIALFKDGRPAASVSRFVPNSHAEHITQAVTMILKLNNISPEEITHIATTVGPGSFTGLRIGISFVKGFCRGQSIKVVPLSSLHIMVHQFRAGSGAKVFSAIDARRDEIFWASFSCSKKGLLNRTTPDSLSSIDSLLDTVAADDIIITDTMGYTRSTVFEPLGEYTNHFPVESFPIHRGFSAAKIANNLIDNKDVWINASELQPQYLRLSSAQLKATG